MLQQVLKMDEPGNMRVIKALALEMIFWLFNSASMLVS